MTEQYEVVEEQTAVNTGIAASASEFVIAGTQRVQQYNSLEVVNNGLVDITISFNGASTRTSGVIKANGGSYILQPWEGLFFSSLLQTNLDAANAEVAGKIRFTARAQRRVN